MVNLKSKKLVLALSGGVDSVVLLHYYRQCNIRAVHINHNLSQQAEKWQLFCRNLCQKMQIDLQVFSINIAIINNIENRARQLRYQTIYQNLKSDEVLLTAHHQDDQAETLLLNLFRGSGVLGLAAMPSVKDRHYRPFLTKSKQWIMDYALQYKLDYIVDESNFNTHFRRNFLRQKVLMVLTEQYPNIAKTLAQTAINQQQSWDLISDLAKLDIENYAILDKNLLQIKGLQNLTPVRIKNVVRYHLYHINFKMPSVSVLEQIILLIFAKNDAIPKVKWGKYSCRRFKNKLYFLTNDSIVDEDFCEFYQQLKYKNGFNIKYKHNGQRIKFTHKNHSQSLKKIMQEWQIPPWERNKLRLYYLFDELIAIEKIGWITKKL